METLGLRTILALAIICTAACSSRPQIVHNASATTEIILPKPTPDSSGKVFEIKNHGKGVLTIIPTGSTINGASSISIPAGAIFTQDGDTYFVVIPKAKPVPWWRRLFR